MKVGVRPGLDGAALPSEDPMKIFNGRDYANRTPPPHLPRPAYRASVAALAGRHQGSWVRYQSMVDCRPSEKSAWAGRQPSSRRSFEASMA